MKRPNHVDSDHDRLSFALYVGSMSATTTAVRSWLSSLPPGPLDMDDPQPAIPPQQASPRLAGSNQKVRAMKNRFRLYRRTMGGVFYVHDSETGKQENLGSLSGRKTRNDATFMSCAGISAVLKAILLTSRRRTLIGPTKQSPTPAKRQPVSR